MNKYHTETYISTVILLIISLTIAVLLIWNNINSETRNHKISEDVEVAFRNWLEYNHQVDQAKIMLRTGNQDGAIDKLKYSIALAQKQGVIPIKHLTMPSEGEMLLMVLYSNNNKLGLPHEGMKQFEAYMKMAYPKLPVGWYDLEASGVLDHRVHRTRWMEKQTPHDGG
jgi:hypothetical protein